MPGKLYVIEFDFNTFSDFDKNYQSYIDSGGITLIDSINNSILSISNQSWYYKDSLVPIQSGSTYSTSKIVVDTTISLSLGVNIFQLVRGTIVPNILKKFSLLGAPLFNHL